MNFRGHLAGGVAASVVMTGVAVVAEQVSITDLFALPFSENPDAKMLGIVFSLTTFMSLFPDLDTASIIQRWFYRVMLALLLITLIGEDFDTFVILSFMSVVPLIDKHRGWTHWRTTPWILAFAFAILNEFLRTKGAWFSRFDWERVVDFFDLYLVYIIGAVVGHYTHLFLDSKTAKKTPYVRQMAKW